jgi:hypothetical protein
MAVFPLIPNYSYKLKRKRRRLLAVMEDGSRTGRVKGPDSWVFELVFTNRPLADFNTLVSFVDATGDATSFTYNDPLRGTSHTCYFDSDVEGEAKSFDNFDFSVLISE